MTILITPTERAARLASLSPHELEVMLRWLDVLRDARTVNTFRALLAEAFALEPPTAEAVVALWRETFAERHPRPGSSL